MIIPPPFTYLKAGVPGSTVYTVFRISATNLGISVTFAPLGKASL